MEDNKPTVEKCRWYFNDNCYKDINTNIAHHYCKGICEYYVEDAEDCLFYEKSKCLNVGVDSNHCIGKCNKYE